MEGAFSFILSRLYLTSYICPPKVFQNQYVKKVCNVSLRVASQGKLSK